MREAAPWREEGRGGRPAGPSRHRRRSEEGGADEPPPLVKEGAKGSSATAFAQPRLPRTCAAAALARAQPVRRELGGHGMGEKDRGGRREKTGGGARGRESDGEGSKKRKKSLTFGSM